MSTRLLRRMAQIAHADVNRIYASAELATPVVVLPSNDGCDVTRSRKPKAPTNDQVLVRTRPTFNGVGPDCPLERL